MFGVPLAARLAISLKLQYAGFPGGRRTQSTCHVSSAGTMGVLHAVTCSLLHRKKRPRKRW